MKFDELPTYKNLIRNIKGFKFLLKIYRILRFFGIKNKNLDDMKNKLEEIDRQR